MDVLDFFAEKIGRKQLIAIVGMVVLWKMGAPSWQVMAVAFAGIGSQLLIDWFHPRKKQQNRGQADGDTQRLS